MTALTVVEPTSMPTVYTALKPETSPGNLTRLGENAGREVTPQRAQDSSSVSS